MLFRRLSNIGVSSRNTGFAREDGVIYASAPAEGMCGRSGGTGTGTPPA